MHWERRQRRDIDQLNSVSGSREEAYLALDTAHILQQHVDFAMYTGQLKAILRQRLVKRGVSVRSKAFCEQYCDLVGRPGCATIPLTTDREDHRIRVQQSRSLELALKQVKLRLTVAFSKPTWQTFDGCHIAGSTCKCAKYAATFSSLMHPTCFWLSFYCRARCS